LYTNPKRKEDAKGQKERIKVQAKGLLISGLRIQKIERSLVYLPTTNNKLKSEDGR
jgi:hypothetical protein